MIDPTDLPTLKTRLRALLADTPHPAHPHVSPADLTAILDELDAGESERARHAEEVARLEAAHLSETRALDDLRLKEIRSLRDQLRKVEGERDAEREHATEMEERALDLVRDLRLAQAELHALRWRPIEECGELEDGWYDVWVVKPEYDGGAGQLMHARRFPSGEFVVAGLIYEAQHITHVHRMGPIRGPGEG